MRRRGDVDGRFSPRGDLRGGNRCTGCGRRYHEAEIGGVKAMFTGLAIMTGAGAAIFIAVVVAVAATLNRK